MCTLISFVHTVISSIRLRPVSPVFDTVVYPENPLVRLREFSDDEALENFLALKKNTLRPRRCRVVVFVGVAGYFFGATAEVIAEDTPWMS